MSTGIDGAATGRLFARGMAAGLGLLLAVAAQGEETGVWKTAYIKRGVVGNYDAHWAGGTGATLRLRVPIPFEGTRARVQVRGNLGTVTELTRMTLVKGADDQGRITGPQYPLLFQGQPALRLSGADKAVLSDAAEVPVTRGTWYVQESFASPKYPYAYEVDKAFFEPGDCFEKETLAKSATAKPGILARVDVFTTDTRPTILCYGDSITHGFGSTPTKEALRQELNGWIRTEAKCDGVIDFDQALADPETPTKMRADCQTDWIHPNDEGYRRMAEAAAKVIGGK